MTGKGQFWVGGREFNMAGAAGSVECGGAAEGRGCTIRGLALEGWGKGGVTRSGGSGLRLPDLECQGHH